MGDELQLPTSNKFQVLDGHSDLSWANQHLLENNFCSQQEHHHSSGGDIDILDHSDGTAVIVHDENNHQVGFSDGPLDAIPPQSPCYEAESLLFEINMGDELQLPTGNKFQVLDGHLDLS